MAGIGLSWTSKLSQRPKFTSSPSPSPSRSSSRCVKMMTTVSVDEKKKAFTLTKSEQAFNAAKVTPPPPTLSLSLCLLLLIFGINITSPILVNPCLHVICIVNRIPFLFICFPISLYHLPLLHLLVLHPIVVSKDNSECFDFWSPACLKLGFLWLLFTRRESCCLRLFGNVDSYIFINCTYLSRFVI